MTIADALNLEIEILSSTEAAAIWKRQAKRAPNYGQYLVFVNSNEVGASFRIKVPAGDKNADNAKEIRRNFAEAAKERTVFVDVTDKLPAEFANAEAGTAANVGDETATKGVDGKWYVERKAPVIIRWKQNTHTEQRTVTDDKGKKGVVDVVVIDSLDALIVASEAVQHRAPRTPTEIVTVASPPADAAKGTVIDLADGRKAKLGADGKWRAPKLPTTSTASSAEGNTANGVAATVGDNTTPAAPLAAVGAAT